MVTIKEDGAERRVRADEAFLLQIARRGLDGDSAAARLAMRAIEEARAVSLANPNGEIRAIVTRVLSANFVLERLGMARKQDRYRPTARMALEPWVVEEALNRLGKRRFSRDEQATVVRATRTPHKVRWPDWWEFRPWA